MGASGVVVGGVGRGLGVNVFALLFRDDLEFLFFVIAVVLGPGLPGATILISLGGLLEQIGHPLLLRLRLRLLLRLLELLCCFISFLLQCELILHLLLRQLLRCPLTASFEHGVVVERLLFLLRKQLGGCSFLQGDLMDTLEIFAFLILK